MVHKIKTKHFNGFFLVLTDLNPSIVCLQETFLHKNNDCKIKTYEGYHYTHDAGFQASGDASVFIRNDILQCRLEIRTKLQL